MKIKVFYPDRDGRISFTKKELEDLLDEVYREGYNDGRPYTWTSPYWGNGNRNNFLQSDASSTNGNNITLTSNNDTYTTNSNDVKYSAKSIQYAEK